ncbi:hypothetical protein FB567DRAFT_545733 [Paraphoma chrysanthemicola]|uniref:Uncharacterized protein n=1 Tax=Paraphoma chrysanthemicola TaxID=798071 RepID=A0A8K0RH12_9PLEO|nr:hypothetical protein FB567DRAFT_545733 [Paraphoma chrysanthemicola]
MSQGSFQAGPEGPCRAASPSLHGLNGCRGERDFRLLFAAPEGRLPSCPWYPCPYRLQSAARNTPELAAPELQACGDELAATSFSSPSPHRGDRQRLDGQRHSKLLQHTRHPEGPRLATQAWCSPRRTAHENVPLYGKHASSPTAARRFCRWPKFQRRAQPASDHTMSCTACLIKHSEPLGDPDGFRSSRLEHTDIFICQGDEEVA